MSKKLVMTNGVCAMASTEFCESQVDCCQCSHGQKIRSMLADYESLDIDFDRLREIAEDEVKGRSTGFPDRNGKIIREHDIVRVTFLDRYSGKEYLREECEVIFDKGAFGIMWGKGNHKEFCVLCSFCVGTTVFYEIIGHAGSDEKKGEANG